MTRLPKAPEFDTLIKADNTIFDIHTHIFNYRDVPNGFVGIRLPFTSRFLSFLENTARAIGIISGEKSPTNASYFLDFFQKDTKEIVQKLMSYYPTNTIFCPLLMDMNDSIKGKQKEPYEKQIEFVKSVVTTYPGKFLPFVCLNPLNPNMENFFNEVIKDDSVFWGVKIYPALGYFPSHPKLMKIFEVCEKRRIPVTTHCSGGAVHNTDHHYKNIPKIEIVSGKPVEVKKSAWLWSHNDYANFFNHPQNWEPVLEQYPNLVLNIAHFGGDEQWKDYISGKDNTWPSRVIVLMQKYPNVYADVSYLLYDRKTCERIKNLIDISQLLRERILYGTDYYMVVLEGHFNSIKTDFETLVGTNLLTQLRTINTKKFLFGI